MNRTYFQHMQGSESYFFVLIVRTGKARTSLWLRGCTTPRVTALKTLLPVEIPPCGLTRKLSKQGRSGGEEESWNKFRKHGRLSSSTNWGMSTIIKPGDLNAKRGNPYRVGYLEKIPGAIRILIKRERTLFERFVPSGLAEDTQPYGGRGAHLVEKSFVAEILCI